MKWLIAILLIVTLSFLQFTIRHKFDIYPDSTPLSVLIGFVIGVIAVSLCNLDESRY